MGSSRRSCKYRRSSQMPGKRRKCSWFDDNGRQTVDNFVGGS